MVIYHSLYYNLVRLSRNSGFFWGIKIFHFLYLVRQASAHALNAYAMRNVPTVDFFYLPEYTMELKNIYIIWQSCHSASGPRATYSKTSASVNFKPDKEIKPASILPALCLAFGGQFLFGALLKFINDALMFVSPQLLK